METPTNTIAVGGARDYFAALQQRVLGQTQRENTTSQ